MIFVEPAGAGAGSTCYIDGSSLRDDDRRSTTRESFRGAPWTAPRPEGRRAAAASRSSSLRPRDALPGTRGRKAVRRATRSPCAARREGRFRAPAGAPDAESKRFVERLRSTNRRRATGYGHGGQGRARRPYGAPPRYRARRDGGAVDSVVARPPGRSRPFARKASRAGSIFWAKPRGQTLYGTRGGTMRKGMMCERERGRGRVVDTATPIYAMGERPAPSRACRHLRRASGAVALAAGSVARRSEPNFTMGPSVLEAAAADRCGA